MATEADPDAEREQLWDDDLFRMRVAVYAARKRRSVREICLAAGLSDEYLSKYASRTGRSTEALARIARELDVRLIDLIDPVEAQDQLVRLGFVVEFAIHLLAGLTTSKRPTSEIDPRQLASNVLQALAEFRKDSSA